MSLSRKKEGERYVYALTNLISRTIGWIYVNYTLLLKQKQFKQFIIRTESTIELFDRFALCD